MGNKPQIDTILYSHFIETAVKSYALLFEGEEHAYIRVTACDSEGKAHGDKNHIQFACEIYGRELQPSKCQYIKENMWTGHGMYRFIDNANELGMPLNGFTALSRWRLLSFLHDEDKKRFPKYRDYEYILQCLGAHATYIKGVDSVNVYHRKWWRDGFDVRLERDPTDRKANIVFGQ